MNRNVTATIAIVLAVAIYYTFTRGVINEVKAVQEVNKQYTSAIANADTLLSVREEVVKAYNSISEDDRLKLEKMVPDNIDNIRLVIDLKGIGAKHGFLIKNIKATVAPSVAKPVQVATQPSSPDRSIVPTDAAMATPTLDTVNVTFDVTAPYLEFISFLQDIEANLRIMDISKLSVSVDDTNQYHFTVDLKTYWLKK